MDPRQPDVTQPGFCKARSKQSGNPCGRQIPPGHKVCYYHGGQASQVLHAARMRLLEATDPALHRLVWLVDHGDTDAVRLNAAKDLLDRAGLKAPKDAFDDQPSGDDSPTNVVNIALIELDQRLRDKVDERYEAFLEKRRARGELPERSDGDQRH